MKKIFVILLTSMFVLMLGSCEEEVVVVEKTQSYQQMLVDRATGVWYIDSVYLYYNDKWNQYSVYDRDILFLTKDDLENGKWSILEDQKFFLSGSGFWNIYLLNSKKFIFGDNYTKKVYVRK
jgi:hypothetical protein